MKDTATGLLAKESLSKKRTREVDAHKLEQMLEKSKGNPYLNMAINKGRRILIKYGKAEYSKTVLPMLARFEAEEKQLIAEGKRSSAAYRTLRKHLKKERWRVWKPSAMGLEANDAINQTQGVEIEEIAQASEDKGLEFVYHVVAKIFNDRGVSAFEVVPFPFDSFYQEINVEIARTIQPDGRIIETPAGDILFATPPEFSQLNSSQFHTIAFYYAQIPVGSTNKK